jgi:hypothetical protein
MRTSLLLVRLYHDIDIGALQQKTLPLIQILTQRRHFVNASTREIVP